VSVDPLNSSLGSCCFVFGVLWQLRNSYSFYLGESSHKICIAIKARVRSME